ncbi:hypothetical protein FPSE_01333 [Fusarium pseudograminearum CS3096]|uniref:Uncharacterized protein n=1 Tax=Fusarium pseudograminearum (strain CS3096) TaxID=1028729 RepID=K3VT08_FUSPC|nr:hypothetical protein FPSE_01333 [Fusarium pseudograminearum CS3096]EKJ78524.1 hypothetical protein FPSE_01333 [Fusarium pseudograminearum CS3096]
MATERAKCHTDHQSGTPVTVVMNSFIALSKINTRDASPTVRSSFLERDVYCRQLSFFGYPPMCRSRACNRTSWMPQLDHDIWLQSFALLSLKSSFMPYKRQKFVTRPLKSGRFDFGAGYSGQARRAVQSPVGAREDWCHG